LCGSIEDDIVAAMGGGELQFAAWSRTGMGAVTGGAERLVRLSLGAAGEVSRSVVLHRAGDALEITTSAFLCTIPAAGAGDFEPNLFPSVELAHPGLPWLLSPPADEQGRVTPWIVLIVVAEQAGVSLASGVLTIDAPARPADELPDLTQAWAWAHAQRSGAAGEAIDARSFARSSLATRSRLFAPRRLETGTRYLACVVPAFASGVAAGLGLPPVAGDALAWTAAVQAPLRLPVYFSYRFATGPGGDFASLARLLVARALGAEVGHRSVDLSAPGWGLPASPGLAIDVGGALRSPAWTPPPPPAGADALGQAILAEIDAAASPPAGQAPLLPPPFYGAASTRSESSASAPAWQDELNGNVAQRIAAGLGALVVRQRRDELATAAWTAAGDAERANQALRQAELAAEITQRLGQRHIAPLASDGEALSIARPLLSRMRAVDVAHPDRPSLTLTAAIRASIMPNAVLTPSLRRLARAGGEVGRQAVTRPGVWLERIDAGAIAPVPAKLLPAGAAGFDEVSKAEHERPRFNSATVEAIDAAAIHWKTAARAARAAPVTAGLRRVTDIPDGEGPWVPPPVSQLPDPDPVQIDEFAAAARAHQAYVQSLQRIPDRAPPALGQAHAARPLALVRAHIEAQFAPERGIVPRMAVRLDGVPPAAAQTLTPMAVRPELDRPLVRDLQDLSPEHVLPGVGGIPMNSVALAASDPAVVRAFLVGANEELGRELLWRGLPGALGHSWLRTFWGRVAPGGASVPDIDPIEGWPAAGATPSPGQLVLLVRGDVLQRYPNALVYALPALWQGSHRVPSSAPPLAPAMAVSLAGDVALFGFDLAEAEARGGAASPAPPGWYFVLAEHPSEPRFGLAASSAPGMPATWRDVAWSSVTPADMAGAYLKVDGPLAALQPTSAAGLHFGVDAAQMAAITLRHPFRVAIHASKLLAT
jgi:hypothetical protein